MKWTKLPQEGTVPMARSSHSISVVEDKIVLWGGENAPRVPVSTDVYMYDIPTGRWTSIAAPNPPCLRVAHAAASVGNKVYIHGGRTEVQEESTLGDLWCFDVDSSTWTELKPTGTLPRGRNYHSACAISTDFYIFGGCGSALPEGGTRRLNDLWRYDTLKNEWEELPVSEAIIGRGGPGFVAAAGALWVIGGFTGKEASDVHRFDLTTKTWQQVDVSAEPGQTPFTARSVFGVGSHTCAQGESCPHASHILVFGGEIDPSDLGHAGAGNFSDATFCMDPVHLNWHTESIEGDIPGPRGWTSSANYKGGVLVSGGMDDSNTRLDDLYYLEYHHHHE